MRTAVRIPPVFSVYSILDLPRGIPYEVLSSGLRARGFVQVSVMGKISDEDISRFVVALGEVCGEHLQETAGGALA